MKTARDYSGVKMSGDGFTVEINSRARGGIQRLGSYPTMALAVQRYNAVVADWYGEEGDYLNEDGTKKEG